MSSYICAQCTCRFVHISRGQRWPQVCVLRYWCFVLSLFFPLAWSSLSRLHHWLVSPRNPDSVSQLFCLESRHWTLILMLARQASSPVPRQRPPCTFQGWKHQDFSEGLTSGLVSGLVSAISIWKNLQKMILEKCYTWGLCPHTFSPLEKLPFLTQTQHCDINSAISDPLASSAQHSYAIKYLNKCP